MSYDQSFVILGLATWGRLNPDDNINPELEACWLAIQKKLTDSETGLLLEHDNLPDPAHPEAPRRAQNPHMHLYEATLQAYEMTGRPIWLERAKQLRAKGLEYFFDLKTGTIVEFIAPDLSTLEDETAKDVRSVINASGLGYCIAKLSLAVIPTYARLRTLC